MTQYTEGYRKLFGSKKKKKKRCKICKPSKKKEMSDKERIWTLTFEGDLSAETMEKIVAQETVIINKATGEILDGNGKLIKDNCKIEFHEIDPKKHRTVFDLPKIDQ